MRRRNNYLQMQPLGEILYAALKRRGLAARFEANADLRLWPQAVGRQIATQTKPERLRNGTLFVKAASSVWVQQLHFMKEEIIEKFNKIAGKEVIREVRFAVDHEISKNTRQITAGETGTAKKILLKDRDKKIIAECASSLADSELAAIIKRVMQAEISLRRRRQKQDN